MRGQLVIVSRCDGPSFLSCLHISGAMFVTNGLYSFGSLPVSSTNVERAFSERGYKQEKMDLH